MQFVEQPGNPLVGDIGGGTEVGEQLRGRP
jgi:hypothetical protein